ncbi:relaxase/mobilization nuclease domain-containing protein [Pseudomonas veronii]
MKFKILTRKTHTAATVKYIQKHVTDPSSMRSTIPKFEDTSDSEYAQLVERKFEKGRAKNQQRLYFHKIVAFHPSDSHKTDSELLDIAEEALSISMPGKRHYVMTVERDTAHPHVHICVALRSLDTKLVHREFVDYIEIGTALEIKHSLYNADRTQKPSPYAPAPNTVQIERKTGSKTIKNDMKESIGYVFENAQDTAEFITQLEELNILVLPNLNSSGVSGLSFEKEGEVFKGSQLNFPIKKIKERFESDPFFTQIMKYSAEKNQSILEKQSLEDAGEKKGIVRKYTNRTIDNHFLSSDEKTYFFKDTNKIAFTHNREKNEVNFTSSNFKSIKAGAQKILETGTAVSVPVTCRAEFKRQAWMVCMLNNYPMSDFYEPNEADYEKALKLGKDEKEKERLRQELRNFQERQKQETQPDKKLNSPKLKL